MYKILEPSRTLARAHATFPAWAHESTSCRSHLYKRAVITFLLNKTRSKQLPSSSNAAGFFVTHSSMYLTPVKMIENEDQQKEPDSSGCAFLGQEPDSAKKEGMAFHTENQIAAHSGFFFGSMLLG